MKKHINNKILLLVLTFAFAVMLSGSAAAASPDNSTNITIQTVTHTTSTIQPVSTSIKSSIAKSTSITLPDPYNTRTGIHYSTIQGAINSAYTKNGDTIDVTPGTYPENVVVSKKLNLLSTTHLGATVYSFLINPTGSGSTISGFNIIKDNTKYAPAGIFVMEANNIHIQNNKIQYGIFEVSPIRTSISGNTIKHGIYLDAPTSVHIVSNTLCSSENGIVVDVGGYTIIEDNTIENNNNAGIDVEDSQNTLIETNLITDNGVNGLWVNNVNYLTIINNNIINNGQDGINLSNGLCMDQDPINNIISQNNINSNEYGIELSGWLSGNTIQFNRITNNLDYGLVDSGSCSVNAEYNWWGNNNAANVLAEIHNTGSGSVTYGPWIVLSISANPSKILVYGTSTITADLLHDSNGAYHNPVNGEVPYTGSANFQSSKGTINNSNFSNGTAKTTTTYESLFEEATIYSTVDNQTVSTNITVI